MFRFFTPAMDALLQERRQLEVDLQHGLAFGEFELSYQPLIDLHGDRVSGFEALLRWNHPTRGLLEPHHFVSVTEEIGLIERLGEWVLHEACREAIRWPDDVKLAVNLSPVQFRHHDRSCATCRADAMAIVRAVTGLGSSLGMSTTAEGVENGDQLARLRAEGCCEAQGFLFSPPRPARELSGLLRALNGEPVAASV